MERLHFNDSIMDAFSQDSDDFINGKIENLKRTKPNEINKNK